MCGRRRLRVSRAGRPSVQDGEGRVARNYTRIRLRFELPADTPFGPGGPRDESHDLACIAPAAANRCGAIGDPPGEAFEIRANGMLCRTARALVVRVQRARCPDARCAIDRTRRVGAHRCRFSKVDMARYRQTVRCTYASKQVTFYVGFD